MENPKKEVNLGEHPDEESKKIAEEMAVRAKEKTDKEAEEAKAKAEKEEAAKKTEEEKKKAEEGKDEDEDEDEEDKDEEEKVKRTPHLMPIYKHKLAEREWSKEKQTLLTQIEELKTKGATKPEQSEAIKKFAEKHGFEEEAVKDLVDLIGSKTDISDELKKKLGALEKERSETYQSNSFQKEFDKEIAPLLEADGVPKENHKKVLKLLKDLAFTEEYAKTPLKVIYKGVEQFDDFRIKGKKSAEGSRGGARGGSVPEKEMRDMTDEEFEKYTDEEAAKGSRNSTIPPRK